MVALCTLPGCRSGSLTLYPVSGEVTVDGRPLAAGSVTLHADSTRGNTSLEIAGGEIRNGAYEIFTGKERGAPPGFYKVLVVSTNFSGDKPPLKGPTAEMPRSLIDPKYADLGQTPLAFEVVQEPQTGSYDLQVTK